MIKKLVVLFVATSLANCAYGVELVTDGGFEAGAFGGTWTEFSSNFGTPICDLGTCGTGGGTGPDGGNWWAWFGGIGAMEQGSVAQQSMAFPNGGSATLSFRYEKPVISGDAADFLEVLIDNTVVWSDDGGSGDFIGYRTETVDISAFADGNTHQLTFNSEIFGAGGLLTNFFVDNVSIDAVVPEPGTGALLIGLALGILPVVRRR